MTLKDNGTFCVLPWLHIHAWPDGSCYLCCIAAEAETNLSKIGDLTTNSVAEIMNSDTMKSIRLDLLNGKQVSRCKQCYKAQELKGYSWRNGFNRQFQDLIPDLISNTNADGSITPNLTYIDFRFSNLCNLECRSCGADLSSKIASVPIRTFPDEKIEFYKSKNVFTSDNVVAFENAKPTFFNDDLVQYLEGTRCFYFAGGEPLIQKEHHDVLTYINDKQWYDKELRYSTNLSNLAFKKTDFVEIWKNFKNVWLMCSIDHVNEKLEYLRQGSSHSRIFKNFDRLMENHFKTTIVSVVSVYNIYYLDEFFTFLDQKGYLEKLHSIDLLYVFGECKSPAILPDWAKQELVEKLNQDVDSDLYQKIFRLFPQTEMSIKGLVNLVNSAPTTDTFDTFLDFTRNLDTQYKTDVKVTFPWLGSVIERYEDEQMKKFNNTTPKFEKSRLTSIFRKFIKGDNK